MNICCLRGSRGRSAFCLSSFLSEASILKSLHPKRAAVFHWAFEDRFLCVYSAIRWKLWRNETTLWYLTVSWYTPWEFLTARARENRITSGGNQVGTTPCRTRHCDLDYCTSPGLCFHLFGKILNFPHQKLVCVVAHSSPTKIPFY